MTRQKHIRFCIFRSNLRTAALTIAMLLAMTLVAQAQTLTVLHAFGDLSADGANPEGNLTLDTQGNLYGTTSSGGQLGGSCGDGCGNVFELKRAGSGYVYRPLYSFAGGNDGASPATGVAIGPNGSLYGTTLQGGGSDNVGTVFNLQPPPTSCKAALCPWRETVLLRFNEGNGDNPFGQPIFDQAGNLYGTTWFGGQRDDGEVFQMTPSSGGWTENIIYSFDGHGDGYQPLGGVIFDHAGNLYGTTRWGGKGGYGVVYQLTPSEGSWTETTLYSFTGGSDGGEPEASLFMDNSGNLYGTTDWVPDTNNPGTVYELTPSGGSWTYKLLYSFPPSYEGAGAVSNLVMDKAGNLYGTTSFEGVVLPNCSFGCGTVFKLTPSSNGWIYTDLYNFTGGADGYDPFGGVVLDSQGNLYGTSYFGGTGTNCLNGQGTCGVVWELTP
ncbi:MAG: choice-of-anchor tandem repeat GloVer-containing protein [Candidatus Korobacteraceae bacterium]|jgi:uncharacterized repeat protein (TIGR03803 family)